MNPSTLATMTSSASVEWETPQDFYDRLNAEFNFHLDVCATDENHKAPYWITKEQDGLKMPWVGPVWLNPPYGKEIGKWVRKAYEESQRGLTVVCLLPARTDTKWFQDCVLPYAELRFIRGRLKFGGHKNAAPFPSVIAIFRGVK